MRLPVRPEPHTIEVEATNHCSARCVFCPHPRMTRPKGYLDVAQFDRFVADVARERDALWLNRGAGGARPFPRFVFAGLGEPTLHPRIAELVRACASRDFWVRMVTNGAHLRPRLTDALVDAGLSTLSISLHSFDPAIYHDMMGLRLEHTLPRIERALAALGTTGVAVEIWRVFPPPGRPRDTRADQARFEAWVAQFPNVTVLGPSEPWSRDGTVAGSVLPRADDSAQRGVWCHNFFFTSNVAWDGAAVMCCVDYHRTTVPLGNAFADGFAAVQRRRADAYTGGPKALCTTCTKWADTEYAALLEERPASAAGARLPLPVLR